MVILFFSISGFAPGGLFVDVIATSSSFGLKRVREYTRNHNLSGVIISRKMVISTGSGVLKANDQNAMSQFGGHITLTIGPEVSCNHWTGSNTKRLLE